MIVYRYEMPDSGGPFCTRMGQVRTHSDIWFNDDTLYCCESIEKLNEWFNIRKINSSNFILRKYEGKVISRNEREIIIQKSTAKLINDI